MTNFLPIVHRELRLASRRSATYWGRSCSAGLVGAVLMAIALMTNEPPSLISPAIFWVLTVIAFGYCLLAGVGQTADALSKERREGTLGLLFLTDLRGYDIVLGKLVITSLRAFFALLAALPLLAVPVMMGGVSMAEFWRITVVLMNTLFFSLAVGLAISAFGVNERSVMLRTFVWLVNVSALPLFWHWAGGFSGGKWVQVLFLFPSPAYGLQISANGLFAAVPSDFWPCMATIATVSLACVITASVRLPRSVAEALNSSAGETQRSRSYRLGFGNEAVRAKVRRYLKGDYPYLWRISRDRTMLHWTLLLASVAVVYGLYIVVEMPGPGMGTPKEDIILVWLGAHWLIKILVAVEACRPFSEDKQGGTLELILCTPLLPSEMLDAQRRRLRELFVLPMAVLCTVNYVVAASAGDRLLRLAFTLGILTLLTDCWALRWTAMKLSLTCRSYTGAVLSTLWRVMVPAWLLLFAFVLTLFASRASGTTSCHFLILWSFAVVVYDLWLGSFCRGAVGDGFRRLAAGTYESEGN